jgi:acetylornithine/succinyldiaminopimelate/putrescine aminotransferase
MDALQKLAQLKAGSGPTQTEGLSQATLQEFVKKDPLLSQAIHEAWEAKDKLLKEFPGLSQLSESDLIQTLQAGFVNFYPEDQTNPYVPIAARGPWIVTFHGAVIHDSGGYGMLGFGHAPDAPLQAMCQPQVMANIMTASFSQHRLVERLKKEIGHSRSDGFPFDRFICVNSGSESMSVAMRISDVNAKRMTAPGALHAGKKAMFLTVRGGFHGRTERPAMISNSSLKKYKDTLLSFSNLNINVTVPPNDVKALREAFAWAEREGVFFEAIVLEPVMGEGDPGRALTPEFYAVAREYTEEHGSLLLMDSIQAGLRTQGCLSVVDYPGFRDLPPPDMETYSKAVNAGQYPLSILALSERAAGLYVRGVYGNTKTANPRALDVAVATLEMVTPALRANIRERGAEFLQKFAALASEFPEAVDKVQGTGLLCCIELKPEIFKVIGHGQLEEYLRRKGIGVIHGGVNALRFTPHFRITSAEIDMICSALREAFKNGPRVG